VAHSHSLSHIFFSYFLAAEEPTSQGFKVSREPGAALIQGSLGGAVEHGFVPCIHSSTPKLKASAGQAIYPL